MVNSLVMIVEGSKATARASQLDAVHSRQTNVKAGTGTQRKASVSRLDHMLHKTWQSTSRTQHETVADTAAHGKPQAASLAAGKRQPKAQDVIPLDSSELTTF